MVFAFRVGSARGTYDVPAPRISGNEIFERHFRVHQNMMEQLVVFLPALWLFGTYVSASIGALVGVAFLVGRGLYAASYVAEPQKRTVGFVIGFLSNVVLVLGSLGGAIMAAL